MLEILAKSAEMTELVNQRLYVVSRSTPGTLEALNRLHPLVYMPDSQPVAKAESVTQKVAQQVADVVSHQNAIQDQDLMAQSARDTINEVTPESISYQGDSHEYKLAA